MVAARRAERARVADEVLQHLGEAVLDAPHQERTVAFDLDADWPSGRSPIAEAAPCISASVVSMAPTGRRAHSSSPRTARYRSWRHRRSGSAADPAASRPRRRAPAASRAFPHRRRAGRFPPRVSTELSGFFTSCATSAAKRSMASMRTQSASVISRSAAERRPISSFRAVKSGISTLRPPPARTRSAARASRRTGPGDRAREEEAEDEW